MLLKADPSLCSSPTRNEQYFDGIDDDADDGDSDLCILMMDFEPNKTKWIK